jgi:hypothetical protein
MVLWKQHYVSSAVFSWRCSGVVAVVLQWLLQQCCIGVTERLCRRRFVRTFCGASLITLLDLQFARCHRCATYSVRRVLHEWRWRCWWWCWWRRQRHTFFSVFLTKEKATVTPCSIHDSPFMATAAAAPAGLANVTNPIPCIWNVLSILTESVRILQHIRIRKNRLHFVSQLVFWEPHM